MWVDVFYVLHLDMFMHIGWRDKCWIASSKLAMYNIYMYIVVCDEVADCRWSNWILYIYMVAQVCTTTVMMVAIKWNSIYLGPSSHSLPIFIANKLFTHIMCTHTLLFSLSFFFSHPIFFYSVKFIRSFDAICHSSLHERRVASCSYVAHATWVFNSVIEGCLTTM